MFVSDSVIFVRCFFEHIGKCSKKSTKSVGNSLHQYVAVHSLCFPASLKKNKEKIHMKNQNFLVVEITLEIKKRQVKAQFEDNSTETLVDDVF